MKNRRSRSYFVVKNGILGLINRTLVLILSFASRTVFIKMLGAEYLGVNGLFSNILSLLSLAELGIGNVLSFSLYEPVACEDSKKISALLLFYKRAYRGIAASVFVFGVAIIPFLRYIVNSDFSNSDIILYYLFFLLNSVFSYFSVYKSALIKAKQEQYITDNITTICKYVVALLQIAVLLVWKSFVLYLSVMILGTLLQNVIISVYADRKYRIKAEESSVSTEEKNGIINNIKSTFLYKIGQVIINYTDNILISILISTVFVGYYSNYSMIISQITGIIGILNTALIASIGNLATEGNSQNSRRVFRALIFLYHGLTAFCSLCFILVFNDFITIWIGDENLLSHGSVVAITFSFYIQNIINPVWIYREAYGLFNEIKYIMLTTALFNVILSIFMGIYWGIAGIVFATGMARLLTTVWYEPKILYSKVFHCGLSEYYLQQGKYIATTVCGLIIVSFLTRSMETSATTIVLKIVLCAIVTGALFIISNACTPELRYWIGKVKKQDKG